MALITGLLTLANLYVEKMRWEMQQEIPARDMKGGAGVQTGCQVACRCIRIVGKFKQFKQFWVCLV